MRDGCARCWARRRPAGGDRRAGVTPLTCDAPAEWPGAGRQGQRQGQGRPVGGARRQRRQVGLRRLRRRRLLCSAAPDHVTAQGTPPSARGPTCGARDPRRPRAAEGQEQHGAGARGGRGGGAQPGPQEQQQQQNAGRGGGGRASANHLLNFQYESRGARDGGGGRGGGAAGGYGQARRRCAPGHPMAGRPPAAAALVPAPRRAGADRLPVWAARCARPTGPPEAHQAAEPGGPSSRRRR